MGIIDEERKKLLLNAMNDRYEIKIFTKINFYKELVKKYSPKIRNIIHSELKSNGLKFTVNNLVTPNISENSYYYISLLAIFFAITENYGLLFQIRTLVLFPPDFDLYHKATDINENNFIQLQYSNHTLVLNSIFDKLLILVNRTLRLGIPDRNVREHSLKNNYWVKKYEINKIIGQISNNINEIRKESNIYRHLGKLGDVDKFLEDNKKINKNAIYKKLQKNEKLMFDSIIEITDGLLIAFRKWDSVIEKMTK